MNRHEMCFYIYNTHSCDIYKHSLLTVACDEGYELAPGTYDCVGKIFTLLSVYSPFELHTST